MHLTITKKSIGTLIVGYILTLRLKPFCTERKSSQYWGEMIMIESLG